MLEPRLTLCAALLVLTAAVFSGVAIADARPATYTDLTTRFADLADETAGLEDAARVARFHERMDALIPGFYSPRFGATPARYDARIARELKAFAELRPRYELVQREFPAAFEAGIAHFRKAFPGFSPDVPVYLLHSLGEMDGGTRELGGKIHLIFGADVIARIHDGHTLTPFLDHELFHVEHARNFPECGEVWCTLWAEGLATYAAKVMNPGADDRQLLLATPNPIRAAVDAHWPAALCFTRARLFSVDSADAEALFVGGGGAKEFPERFGYYVGLRIAEEAGGKSSLPELASLKPGPAKLVLVGAVDRLVKSAGGCAPRLN